MSDVPGALIIGDDYRALSAVRSLGRRGISVWILAERGEGPAQYSRYCARRVDWLGVDDGARRETLERLATHSQLSGWVIFPTDDLSAQLVARMHGTLSPHLRPTVEPWDKLERSLDKRLAAEAARASGVEVPETWDFPSAAAAVRYPAILKPAIVRSANEFTEAKAWRVDGPDELTRAFAEATSLVPSSEVLVQELIEGGGDAQFSFAALCDRGEPLAHLVAIRRRQYPIDFGHSSSFVEVVDAPSIETLARRLLRELEYTGLVEIEFKRDPSSRRCLLLDVNPRLWTWVAVGARAGVDFPYLAWLFFTAQPLPRTRAATGAAWMRLATDVPAALAEIGSGRLSLVGYARSLLRKKSGAAFAPDDPLPGLLDTPILLRRIVRRRIAVRAERRSAPGVGRGRGPDSTDVAVEASSEMSLDPRAGDAQVALRR